MIVALSAGLTFQKKGRRSRPFRYTLLLYSDPTPVFERLQPTPAVVAASEIWSVRDPRKFAALRAPLAVSHPELDDFCDDYTEEFARFCAAAGKQHIIIDQSVHDSVDDALKAYEPGDYVVPSSGLIVIAEVLRRYPDDDVAIAGFGHIGWDGHPFAAEKRLVDSYVSSGRLTRIAENPLASSSQGA